MCINMASFYSLIMALKLKLLFSCLPLYSFLFFLFSYFESRIQPRLTSNFLCSPGPPRTFKTHCLPHKCQAYTYVPPHLVYVMLDLEPRASCVLEKHSTIWVIFPALLYTFKLYSWLIWLIIFHLCLFSNGYSVATWHPWCLWGSSRF